MLGLSIDQIKQFKKLLTLAMFYVTFSNIKTEEKIDKYQNDFSKNT